jgi:hypothetical protein
MAAFQARDRPVWKSTRPDDPAGASKPIPASLQADIHRIVISHPRSITVEILLLQSRGVHRDPALNKVKRFQLLEKADATVRVVALLKDDTETPEEVYQCFAHVQALSVHPCISEIVTDTIQYARYRPRFPYLSIVSCGP